MAVTLETIDQEYARRFAGSAALFERAKGSIAGGVTHDSRYIRPFPIYVTEASGCRKRDVDGGSLIDYWMGHGALILGHSHPVVTEAIERQLKRGTHYGACHELEIEWAEKIREMVPGVDLVRFVSSGTEATQLAMRIARASTGKQKVLKFAGHFHGWHDAGSAALVAPFRIPASAGVSKEAVGSTVVVPPNDLDAVEKALSEDGDIAAIIVEPGGGSWGAIPTDPEFLRKLPEVAHRYGALVIFDEVVTGFRLAAGGAQEYYGVRADLVCYAKILAGGLPAGAVCGKAEYMRFLEFRDDQEWNRYRKIAHQGTFNANPLAAAAGIAALSMIQTGEPIARSDEACSQLVDGFNQVMRKLGVNGRCYGQSSMFHIALDLPEGEPGNTKEPVEQEAEYEKMIRQAKGAQTAVLRKAMLLEGVDLMRTGGFLSMAHTDADLEFTLEAFERALVRLRDAGVV